MSFRASSTASTDIVGAIYVDESEEYTNEEEDDSSCTDGDNTPNIKTQQRKQLPSRPPPTASASFRLPSTRTTASQPAASASFSIRNRPAAASGTAPDSPTSSTLSRFASFFRPQSSRSSLSLIAPLTASTTLPSVNTPTPTPALSDGMEVIKLDRHGGMARKHLFFHYDDTTQTGLVSWDSDRRKTDKAVMHLSQCRLECGYRQGYFALIRGKEKGRLVAGHCFSLVGEKRSLDVICKTTADANAWIAAISPYLAPLTALPPCAGRLMRVCESHIRGGAVKAPTAVSVSPVTGQLFVCNTGADNILVMDRQGQCTAVWGKRGTDDTSFSAPAAIAMGCGEAVCYVGDVGNSRVQVLDVRGALHESWADHDHSSQPVSITVSPHTHRLYIADQSLRCIQIYTPDGKHIRIIQVAERDCVRIGGIAVVGKGEAGMGSDEQLWVSNSSQHRIECYDVASGVWVRSIGVKGGNQGKLGQLFTPKGLAFDTVHRLLYVCDTDNHRIQVYSVDRDEWCFQWGREGTDVGEFSKPSGVAVCPLTGCVFVADTRNDRVQCFY